MFPACTTYAEDNHEKSHPLPPLPSLFLFSKSLCSQHPLCHFSQLCYLSFVSLSEGELHEGSDL
jgi:hypothetical protein